jgi:basic membrane lipoprotein Med (substrate-binding protein (PBP1-ABC) superfamily)
MPGNQEGPGHPGGGEKRVKVAIGTTSGFFPPEGFDDAPVNQKVEVQLKNAAKELNITDTTGWVITVTGPTGKRIINPSESYADNNLSGEVTIDWGPSEGGGG